MQGRALLRNSTGSAYAKGAAYTQKRARAFSVQRSQGAPSRQHFQLQGGVDRQVLAALSSDSAGWGEARPDWSETCLDLDQDAPGPLTDLDAEWQEFLAANSRRPQLQPLIWNGGDAGSSSSGRHCLPRGNSSMLDSDSDDAEPSTSNRGLEASTSSSSSSSGSRFTSSIQSFDDWDFAEDDGSIPVPCNLPVNETTVHSIHSSTPSSSSSSGASLASLTSSSSGAAEQQLWATLGALPSSASRDVCSPADLLTSRSLWHSLREVYVLLFGVGQKDTEGIYSLRAVSDDGLPTETIIAFENMEDAIRYAALLEATMEHCPHVCSIPPTELMAFCSDSGYRCRLELEGSLLMPPDYNVHITDWERSLRLREGKFHVLPEEPEFSSSSNSSGRSHPAAAAGLQDDSSQLLLCHSELSELSDSELSAAQFTAAQLDCLKAQLEALLPATPAELSDEDC
uniref:Uncharacterized protein n=1 Tax=Tetradesmus obliquus TaxID=3088 RepID=A0A383W481_TETOB|eukprot:jgi/Sobl393_1/12695/SZX71932.1